MQNKVLAFYGILILVLIVLALVQFSSFGSLTGYVSFENTGEWTLGKSFGVGYLGNEVKGDEVFIKYEIEDYDDADSDLVISYGFGDEMKNKKVILGAGENLRISLKERVSDREKFRVVFDDGINKIEQEVDLSERKSRISSYAIEGENDLENNKFSRYGIVFVVLILAGFIFEFVYQNIKKRQNYVGHRLGRRFDRKTIEMDVS